MFFVFWLLQWPAIPPYLSLFWETSYFLRHNNTEIRPIKNLQVPLSVQVRVKSLILNWKLRVIKLSEEGMSKAETGQKPALLHQTAK